MRATMQPMTRLMQALILLLALSACGGEKVPQLPRLASDATVLAFGDSLTYGTGAKTEEAYPARLAQITGLNIINAGIPGETSAEGLARLSSVLDETEPDLVILCLGGNDMLRKLDLMKMQSNLSQMIREIQGRKIALILLATPRPSILNLKSDPVYAALAKENKLPIENEIFAEVIADSNTNSDHIHPNARGYQKVAEAIAELMRKAGAI
ncbi:arylesterase [Stenotrophobium rhamnosiphilum]|uniref:Arylesterase n=2 Tax=Stenotrophobium rhamnosiphilum TaxID=2029166 RepID=A0A2T5MHL3_9GAMM|nr:arylesterase [Stenotrophobium rhamnosiphilum]